MITLMMALETEGREGVWVKKIKIFGGTYAYASSNLIQMCLVLDTNVSGFKVSQNASLQTCLFMNCYNTVGFL